MCFHTQEITLDCIRMKDFLDSVPPDCFVHVEDIFICMAYDTLMDIKHTLFPPSEFLILVEKVNIFSRSGDDHIAPSSLAVFVTLVAADEKGVCI